MTAECFALLDDASPLLDGVTVAATSRLYTDHVATLRCDTIGDWRQVLDAMQAALARGEYAVTLCSYELGVALLGIADGLPGISHRRPAATGSETPTIPDGSATAAASVHRPAAAAMTAPAQIGRAHV